MLKANTGDIPPTPVAFEILLALAEGERHGYDILLDIEARTEGRLKLYPGSLYRAIARLLDQGLIEELERSDLNDERRRTYRLTARGRRAARSEAERMERQVEVARLRKILGRARTT